MSKFSEKLYTYMYGTLSSMGINPNLGGMERLRTSTEELAKCFSGMAKAEAIEVAVTVQTAVEKACDAIEVDVQRLGDKIMDYDSKLKELGKKIDDLTEEVAQLYKKDE